MFGSRCQNIPSIPCTCKVVIAPPTHRRILWYTLQQACEPWWHYLLPWGANLWAMQLSSFRQTLYYTKLVTVLAAAMNVFGGTLHHNNTFCYTNKGPCWPPLAMYCGPVKVLLWSILLQWFPGISQLCGIMVVKKYPRKCPSGESRHVKLKHQAL